MPIVRSYNLPEVEARPVPNAVPQVPAAGELGSFGGNQARDLQVAGANLDQTSNNVFGIYERAAKEANDAKVETDLNGFIERKQKALADFVQLKGQAAVEGSQAATQALTKLRQQTLDGAKNAYQRDVLGRRLDLQMFDATGTITSHTANQASAWQKDTLAARGALIDRDGIMKRDDPDAIAGQLAAKATIGIERARLEHGAAPDSDIAKVYAADEQSKYLKGVIQAQIDDGNKRKALALYDRYGDILKRDAGVASVMKGVRTEIDGENAANAALAKVGLPQIRSGDGGAVGNLPAAVEMRRPQIQKAAETSGAPAPLIAGVMAQESGGRDDAVSPAGARGPMQLMPGTARDLGVSNPHDATQAVPAGARYLKAQLDKYGDEKLALMAYNWGPGNVDSWIKAGSDPSKIPAETRDYVGKVQAYAARFGGPTPTYRGDLKAGYEQAAATIQNDSSLSPEVRANALATLNKTSTQVTSYVDSKTKALKDKADSYRFRGYLNPAQLDPAQLASFADEAAALGNQSLADTYRLYASLAPSLKDGLQSMPADQLKLLKSLEEGPAKKLLEGIDSGNAETLAKANDAFDKLKKAQADGLNPNGLKDMATKAAQLYADAGKSEKAREVAQTFGTMTAAGNVLAMNPVAQKQALAELEDIASKGQINEQQVEMHRLLKQGIASQQAEFDKDAFAAGQKLYGLPALPITDGAGRMEQAAKIASARGTGPIAPLSQEEFNSIRAQADTNPLAARDVFRSLAANYPPEAIPLIGAGLAGKADTNDPVSRGYAAALNFYAEGQHDPAQRVIGDEILDGIAKRREMGDALRNMPKSDAFHQAVQDKMGNAFKSLSGKVPAIIVNAAEAIYTSRMIKAGRQGEKALDPEVFNSALDAVVGKPITVNGQSLVPPKGVGSYQFDQALRSLSDGDVADFKTMNGSPVTAEKIARYGMLSNAGGDGQYFVELPDPARGGAPAYVQRPDGRPYVLEINPLIERSQRFPNYRMETPNSAKDARRRAPASPTEGLQ